MKTTSKWSKRALKFLNFEIEIAELENIPKIGKNFFVANHLSYLDIPIIASVNPTLFITSIELGKTFFQGTLASMGGSLFIERRNISRLLSDVQDTKKVLDSGLPLLLFPEGTTSDGTSVRNFKSSMYAVAKDANIIPICLKYKEVNGQKINASNKNILYYFGGIKFKEHFLGLVKLKSAKVKITFLPAIKGSEDRKKICNESREKILAEYLKDNKLHKKRYMRVLLLWSYYILFNLISKFRKILFVKKV